MTATQRRFLTIGLITLSSLALHQREAAAQSLGACCTELGCIDLFEAQCNNLGGGWLGMGTSCAQSDCDFGACCLVSGCQDLNRGTCRLQGGTFLNNVSCSTNPCTPGGLTGACCASATPGSPCGQQTQENCEAAGRVFIGPGIPCTPNPCGGTNPTAACCGATGCSVETQANCNSIGGQWLPTVSQCGDTTCEVGACCTSAGCLDLLQSECQSAAGTWQFPALCIDNPCAPPPVGACCASQSPTSPCTQDTQANCESLGRFYIGDGISCEPNPCGTTNPVAACCAEEGCFELTQPECLGVGGEWLPGAPACNPGLCEIGKCCLPDNSCVNVFELHCDSLGGVFESGAVCPASQLCEPPAVGACCVDIGPGAGCVQATQADCEAGGRIFIGAGVSCTPSPCLGCQTCPGDANNDGVLDGRDVEAFLNCLVAANNGAPPVGCECADMNSDNLLTLDDVDPFVAQLIQNGGPCGG